MAHVYKTFDNLCDAHMYIVYYVVCELSVQ